MGEMRVALDQRDRAGKAFLAQIVGDRTADDCPADDDDVISRHVFPFLSCHECADDRFAIARQGLARASTAGQEDQMNHATRPRRSVLFVPASNGRAIAKLASLDCDAVIFDLEDAVAPEAKADARENLRGFFAARGEGGPEMRHPHQPARQRMGHGRPARGARLQARRRSCCPKVNRRATCSTADDMLDETDAPACVRLWTMIETAKAMLNIGATGGTRPRPRCAPRLFRCRYERSGEGNRDPVDARPALSGAMADADGAGGAGRRARRSGRGQQ